MNQKELTENRYWNEIYKHGLSFNLLSNNKWLESYYYFALRKVLSRYMSDTFKNVLEIGCAPGNYLIKLHRYFGVEPYGIEYAEDGYSQTQENFKKNNLNIENIFFGDFFDPEFLKNQEEIFDIVFSAGFIEHFTNPKEVIEKQMRLVSPGGILVCLIPNVKYLNEFFTARSIVDIHNQSIMELREFRNLFPANTIIFCDYFGGLINTGLYRPQNLFQNIAYYTAFIIQRAFFDPLQKIIFFIFRTDVTSKFTSPSLLCIIRKK